MKFSPDKQRGFTLLELIVSLSIFTIVMLIAVSTMLSVVFSSRKARSQQLLMDNLHFAVDGMVRNIRVGTNYHCGNQAIKQYHEWIDCAGGKATIAFEGAGGDPLIEADTVLYGWGVDNEILVSKDDGANWNLLTAPGVVVQTLTFYVTGSDPNDAIQPKVRIVARGYVEIDARTRSDFDIQTLVSQRILDE